MQRAVFAFCLHTMGKFRLLSTQCGANLQRAGFAFYLHTMGKFCFLSTQWGPNSPGSNVSISTSAVSHPGKGYGGVTLCDTDAKLL